MQRGFAADVYGVDDRGGAGGQQHFQACAILGSGRVVNRRAPVHVADVQRRPRFDQSLIIINFLEGGMGGGGGRGKKGGEKKNFVFGVLLVFILVGFVGGGGGGGGGGKG